MTERKEATAWPDYLPLAQGLLDKTRAFERDGCHHVAGDVAALRREILQDFVEREINAMLTQRQADNLVSITRHANERTAPDVAKKLAALPFITSPRGPYSGVASSARSWPRTSRGAGRRVGARALGSH